MVTYLYYYFTLQCLFVDEAVKEILLRRRRTSCNYLQSNIMYWIHICLCMDYYYHNITSLTARKMLTSAYSKVCC